MRNGLVSLIVGGGLVLAACGGGGGPASSAAAPSAEAPAAESSAPAGGGTESVAPPSAEPSVAIAPSPAPAGGGGGGAAVGICELVTAEELAGIYGVGSVTQTVIPGPPDNCIVESDAGDALTAWSLMTAQAGTVFSAMTSDPTTVEVPGIGDKAAIVQNTGLLVLKGSSLLSVALTALPDMSETEILELAKQVAAAAAGRL